MECADLQLTGPARSGCRDAINANPAGEQRMVFICQNLATATAQRLSGQDTDPDASHAHCFGYHACIQEALVEAHCKASDAGDNGKPLHKMVAALQGVCQAEWSRKFVPEYVKDHDETCTAQS